ncbi:2-oxoglutarate dehydrogenase E1 component [Candidatus Photodesmus blepharus]|uniref:2-oxoglutarate dehydrogenase E1 component n=1 Tax=Candidatus Photodesmus blepharonis TaxID=1179155 RepID=A0A084CN07_9GAMM|nr:2-oxoglutarate dehydrogenase E1 component [Candidatus Photodesmus blepharus]KEY91186.1 2-oxoglutarate dehydrogenase E1 component [Candidatus Photodesmus blepharus]
MHEDAIEVWLKSSHLAGSNASYVEELYELYLDDPNLVSEEWRRVFEDLPVSSSILEQPHSPIRDYFKRLAREIKYCSFQVKDLDIDVKQVKVLQLINAYRFRGHQAANLDPLNLWKRDIVADLDPSFHSLSKDDFQKSFNVGSFFSSQKTMALKDLYKALNQTYCGSIGAEYMHMTNTEEKRWIQRRLESILGQPAFNKEEKYSFLSELSAAEGLERYLAVKFPGAKRFSLEGGDTLIPMMKEIIRHSGIQGIREVVVGMAHRGRLNMLVNVLGKKTQDLFDEFAGKNDETWGTGDVKYHQGFSADFATLGGNVHLVLAFNPSHLEIVNPVVIGSVRARQDRLGDKSGSSVLPITIHGDSAVAGQGVVQETFNMSQARGFCVGGTIRVVINNQIGFTTSNPRDTRSTMYCTDIAKVVQAPIFHVNADDPEAAAFVARLALDYRNTFKRDVVIDLVCYRRNGHNEADEPNATQPLMYQKIKKHPTPRKLYSDTLIKSGEFDIETTVRLVNEYRDALDRGEVVVNEWRPMALQSVDWTPYFNHDWNIEWDSQVAIDRLRDLGNRICRYPETHKLQNRVKKLYSDRLSMINGDKPVDWGMAETLAYATLADDGKRIRISGQDSGRGTFFHRHAVLHNQLDASIYIPLANIHDKQGPFQIFDSVLSEEAVLAFEYGYATAEPGGLTLWEAQFGDFANGAQVVIDQFISSGEQKWARLCGLTMLLPHGYEGQGPEHSSARLERYLQLCAEQNMQVVIPSTPAQVYHMIRRQVIRPMRRPLIVMSPKSLLRHPLCTSSLKELAEGTFQAVLGEVDSLDKEKIKRVVFCSGKVYFDVLEERRNSKRDDVAIIRVEQLYPFPLEELETAIAEYTNVVDYVWCQEEPQNQGAWYNSQHNFRMAIPSSANLRYAGRPASASPAVGYMSVHLKQQKELVKDALNVR